MQDENDAKVKEAINTVDTLREIRERTGLNYIKVFDPLHENRHERRRKAKIKAKPNKYSSDLDRKARKRIKASQKRNRPVRKPESSKASAKGAKQ